MGRRSDTSLASLLLTQRLVDTDAAPLKASEYHELLATVNDPGRLLGRTAEAIAADTGLSGEMADRVECLLGAATAFAFALDEAERSGLRAIATVDEEYPGAVSARLGRSAPPILYVVGDLALLKRDHLGIVGSRDVSDAAAAAATGAARSAVANGWGVVSGAAKGVDRLAMGAALEDDGFAVGVLADSLVRMTRDAEVRRAVTEGKLCLCTPYKPTAGFSVANAMGRNKVIYALSQATLVVTSDLDKGGTWAGATESLKQRIAPVLVWTGAGAGRGNQALVDRGGKAIGELGGLLDLARRTEGPPAGAAQLHLGV